MQRSPARGGFSLMEVLVGLTLLSLIALSVSQTMRIGLRIWQASERDDGALELVQTSRLVESWVTRALPPTAFDKDGPVVFQGLPDRLTFLVDGQAGRKLIGYSRMSLSAVANPDCSGRQDLVLTWEDVAAASHLTAAASDTRVLVACAETIRFRYGGPRRGAQGRELVNDERWLDETFLPSLVSVEAQAGDHKFSLTTHLRYSGR